MGLDMYLEKKTNVKAWNDEDGASRLTGSIQIPGIQPDNVTFVTEEVAYWRKANAIHQWFVEHVQDGVDECQLSFVSVDQLEELLQVINVVLEHPDQAATLLPTQPGFFFGSTEYDGGYFGDLKETQRLLSAALADPGGGEFYYQSSW